MGFNFPYKYLIKWVTIYKNKDLFKLFPIIHDTVTKIFQNLQEYKYIEAFLLSNIYF